jgi:hypothetical protein
MNSVTTLMTSHNTEGPEYNFPGNCYSEDLLGNPGMLQSMAAGTGMIGR